MWRSLWKNVEKGEISKNAKIDDEILLITPLYLEPIFQQKAVLLSFQRKKEFLKSVKFRNKRVMTETQFHVNKIAVTSQKFNNWVTLDPISKIYFSLESWHVQLTEACSVSSLSFLEPEILAHKVIGK